MASIDPRITIEEFLDSHDLEYERKDQNTFLVSLPGEKKLQTHCALIVGDHSLSINAFVIRKPDDNEAGVHAYCMLKNAGMYGIAFATNELGDIFCHSLNGGEFVFDIVELHCGDCSTWN